MATNTVRGRYAPSPTGDQHLGNLRTALIAWLHARLQGGEFLLRMEDLDLPRVVDGSADTILRDLEWLGIDWDGEVVYQSQRNDLYQAALDQLDNSGLVYPCFCSRKDIQQAASAPHSTGNAYPGTCRNLRVEQQQQRRLEKTPALRLNTEGKLQDSCGDFVIKRADGLFAYQLAVVVDDLEQGITKVVRGADLADSTQRQKLLIHKLEPQRNIDYFHAPLCLDENGERLSKRDGSKSVQEFKQAGVTAEELVGKLLSELGLLNSERALTAEEALQAVSLSKLEMIFE